MSTPTRVFLARLAGIGVFDPSGDQLGKVRDAVTTLRVDRQPPRVLGLVVELQHRHRIFVPMGRVTRIEPDQVVLSSGTVNMKRFERRANETLVLAELLDRTVTHPRERPAGRHRRPRRWSRTRTRDWVISRLAVRTRRAPGSPRRRGQLSQVEWDEVDGLGAARGRPGHRRAAGDAVRHAGGRRRPRAAGHARQAPHRGGPRPRRRAAGRRAAGDGRGRPGRHAARARGRAGRRRPRGDGRRRRRRPARRDGRRRPGAAAGADGARRRPSRSAG